MKIEQNKIEKPDFMSDLAFEFIISLMKTNPSERSSLDAIENHPWL